MTDAVDLHICHLVPNAGIADWRLTTAITRVELRPNGLHLEFSKQDGAGRWPDVVPSGWDGPIQYTIWLGAAINGQPEFAACLNWWRGEPDQNAGPITDPDHFPANLWYLNRALQGHTPRVGEQLGLFVTAGAARGIRGDFAATVHERSNVVAFPMPDKGGATYTFPDDVVVVDSPPPPPPSAADLRAILVAGVRDQRDALTRLLERLES